MTNNSKPINGIEAEGNAVAAPSPTSDPHRGPHSEAADRIMPDDKIALNLAEGASARDLMSKTVDTGLSE